MITLVTVLGGVVAFFVSRGFSNVAATQKRNQAAETIVENHAVAVKIEAAQTPEDAYAALKADRDSDRK